MIRIALVIAAFPLAACCDQTKPTNYALLSMHHDGKVEKLVAADMTQAQCADLRQVSIRLAVDASDFRCAAYSIMP